MKIIGVEVATEHGFGRALLEGISAYAAHKNDARLCSVAQNPPPGKSLLRSLDGLIFRLFGNSIERQVKKLGVPTVDIYGEKARTGIAQVHGDYAKIAQLAAELFLARGFTNFAWCGVEWLYFSRATEAEFDRVIRHAGHPVFRYNCPTSLKVPFVNNAPDRIPDANAMLKWIRRIPKPCAVFCCNDHRAYQVMRLAVDDGILIPDEMAILGIDNDTTICAFADVPISSIDPDAFRMGQTAARILDTLIHHPIKNRLHRRILIPPKGLVERQSTHHIPISPPWLAKALITIENGLGDNISAGEVVRTTGFSAPVVERMFREKFGCSIVAYINRRKLKLASKLLGTTNLRVKEIAAACGYSSAQYFCKMFKEHYGVSAISKRRNRRTLNSRLLHPVQSSDFNRGILPAPDQTA